MITQNFDFLFQLQERFLDSLGKAGFYAKLPKSFDYTDKAYRDLGGTSRYIFLAPPTIVTESSAPQSDFLKVSFPFRLNRPDDVGKFITGTFFAEVRILKVPSSGVPDHITLDFGNMGLTNVDSASLREASDLLANSDGITSTMLLIMLGASLLDANGNIQFDEFIHKKIVDYVHEEIGHINITPALKEVNKVGLPLTAVDLKVIDTPLQSEANKRDAICLLLNFQGNAGQGNKAAIESFLRPANDFGMAIHERLIQAIMDDQIQKGNLPLQFDHIAPFPVILTNMKIAILEGKLRLTCHLATKHRVNYGLWKTTHNISADARVDFGLSIDAAGAPIATILDAQLTNLKASGFLGFLLSIVHFPNPGNLLKAPMQKFVEQLLAKTGTLQANWALPENLPYRLKVKATAVQLFNGEMTMAGTAALTNLDGTPFLIPPQFSWPVGPEAIAFMTGSLKKRQTLLSSHSEKYFKAPKVYQIQIPCPGSGIEIPSIYYTLPELKMLILQGVCGRVDLRVTYQLQWTRTTKTYQNTYHGDFEAYWQFLGLGQPKINWFLRSSTEVRRPLPAERIGTEQKISFDVPRTPATAKSFSLKLLVQVEDVFGVKVANSELLEGDFEEKVVTENPDPVENATRQRELLLDRIQIVSDEVSKLLMMQHIPAGKAARADSTALQTLEIVGEMQPMAVFFFEDPLIDDALPTDNEVVQTFGIPPQSHSIDALVAKI